MRRGQTVVDLVKDIGGHGVVGVERQHRSKEEGQGKGERERHHMLDVGETGRLETPQPIWRRHGCHGHSLWELKEEKAKKKKKLYRCLRCNRTDSDGLLKQRRGREGGGGDGAWRFCCRPYHGITTHEGHHSPWIFYTWTKFRLQSILRGSIAISFLFFLY